MKEWYLKALFSEVPYIHKLKLALSEVWSEPSLFP